TPCPYTPLFRSDAAPVALEAADELGREVLRIGRRSAVAAHEDPVSAADRLDDFAAGGLDDGCQRQRRLLRRDRLLDLCTNVDHDRALPAASDAPSSTCRSGATSPTSAAGSVEMWTRSTSRSASSMRARPAVSGSSSCSATISTSAWSRTA